MKDILVIMGSHPRTRRDFDWSRTDCDILVFNEAMKMDWVKRADYVMQMHLPVIWQNPGNRNDPNHYNWLKSGETPVIWMQEKYEDVPKAERYPLEDILKIGRRYITSSAAYSIALGIHLGYQKIEIYGVEMETNTEYQHQRPGVAYWVGVADALGINVDFHGSLLDCPLYGYEGDIKFPYAFFDERREQLFKTAEEAREEYNKARDVANAKITEYMDTGKEPKEIITLMQKAIEMAAMFGLQDGARQEIERYKKKADIQKAATGDYLFSRQEFEHAATSFMKERDTATLNATKMAEKTQAAYQVFINTNNKSKKQNRLDQFTRIVSAYIQAATTVGMFDGAAKENKFLMSKLDELIRMAGGAESERVMMGIK